MSDTNKCIASDKWYGDRFFQKDFYDAMEYVQETYEKNPVEDRKEKFGLMICIPTGGGKTRLMVTYTINEFLYASKRRKVLWLAQSNELLDQARETFLELLSDEELKNEVNAKDEFCYAEYFGGKDNPICDNTLIAFASFQTLNSANGSKDKVSRWLERDSIIIVDEAHHAPANTYQSIIKDFTQEKSRLMFGLSATPMRTQMEKNDDLNELFPTKLINSKGVYVHVSLDELVKDGHLVPRRSEEVIYNLSEEELQTYEKESEGKDKYQVLGNVLGKSADFNHLVASHYLKNCKEYGKTVIFTASKSQASSLKATLDGLIKEEQKNVQTYLVTGDDKSDLEPFKASKDPDTGETKWETSSHKVMINIKVLGEGVDIRDIHTVFLAKPSKSPIDITQMVGRALRSVPVTEGEEGWKREANIVNFAVRGLESKLIIQDPRFTMDLYELECGLRSDVLENRDKGKQKQEIENLLQKEAAEDMKLPFISFAMIGYYEITLNDDGTSVMQIVTKAEYEKITAYLKNDGAFPRTRLHFHGGRRYAEQKKIFEIAKVNQSAVFHPFYNELTKIEELKKELKECVNSMGDKELREWSDKKYEELKNEQGLDVFVKDRRFSSQEEFWDSIRAEALGMVLESDN